MHRKVMPAQASISGIAMLLNPIQLKRYKEPKTPLKRTSKGNSPRLNSNVVKGRIAICG